MNELKPIRTEAEHAEAMREIDALLADMPEPGTAEFDRLEALSILVHAYEQKHPHHRIEDVVDPVEAIKFHLDRLGKSAKDLATVLRCSRPRAWEILNRKRALTLPQIRALVRWGIPADRLVAEYAVTPRRSAHRSQDDDRHSSPPPA